MHTSHLSLTHAVIHHPVVCGVTSLGFDHMELLGDTLPAIAREKGGILKRGTPAWTVAQPDDAFQALQAREEGGRGGAGLLGAASSGIFERGTLAWTVAQPDDGFQALQARGRGRARGFRCCEQINPPE